MISDHHFAVEIGGNHYKIISVSGLSMQRSLVETRVGDSPDNHPTLESGQSFASHVVLRRYFDPGDATFYNWYHDAQTPTQDVMVKLLNKNHEPVAVWQLWACLPVRLSYSELTADIAEPVIEELEVACEFINMQFR